MSGPQTMDGVFKSTNAGVSWTRSGLAGYARTAVLAVDPQNSNTVYVSATAIVFVPPYFPTKLFKTTNGGASWTEVDSGLPGYSDVMTLAIDPRNSNTLYAGTPAGVFRTTNGGASWSALNDGFTSSSPNVSALVMDPKNPGTLYAGTGDGVFMITLVP